RKRPTSTRRPAIAWPRPRTESALATAAWPPPVIAAIAIDLAQALALRSSAARRARPVAEPRPGASRGRVASGGSGLLVVAVALFANRLASLVLLCPQRAVLLENGVMELPRPAGALRKLLRDLT